MKCISCGAEIASDQLNCPYCNAVNENALKYGKELQQYDKQYEAERDELIQTGTSKVLKRITVGLGLSFLLIVLLFGAYTAFYEYRFGEHSTYQVTGARYAKNLELMDTYMENKQYMRAYALAVATDPTNEAFTYYPKYKKELDAIYNYIFLFQAVERSMEEMDNGDNYKGLQSLDLISFSIFYECEDSAVKAELEAETDQYLKNYYQLTEEEIAALKTEVAESYDDFTIDGSSDIEGITKERMVAYFGK